MNITFKTKDFFFDRKTVLDHFGERGKNTLKALSRIGSFVRTRARSLLRPRKRISSPGEAASVHTSDQTVTLKNIQFAYDFQTASVVVGSVLTNSSRRQASSQTVPNLLEVGGTANRRGKTLRYSPHPWMGPSLQAEMSNLPAQFSANLNT